MVPFASLKYELLMRTNLFKGALVSDLGADDPAVSRLTGWRDRQPLQRAGGGRSQSEQHETRTTEREVLRGYA